MPLSKKQKVVLAVAGVGGVGIITYALTNGFTKLPSIPGIGGRTSWQIFKGTQSVNTGQYAEKNLDYNVTVPPGCTIKTASINYYVKPDGNALFGQNFYIDVNESNVVHEYWSGISGANPKQGELNVSLRTGNNIIHLKWDKTALLMTVNFDTDVVLTVEYEGTKPSGTGEIIRPEDMFMLALIFAGVAVGVAAAVKIIQVYRRKEG